MNCTDPKFRYTPAANTDVAKTHKKHGAVPVDVERQQKMRELLNPTYRAE